MIDMPRLLHSLLQNAEAEAAAERRLRDRRRQQMEQQRQEFEKQQRLFWNRYDQQDREPRRGIDL